MIIVQIPKEILNNIADDMESGFTCFVHKDTYGIVSFISEDKFPDVDPDDWKDQMDKIKKDKIKFIIEEMDSRESFRVMEEFIDSIENNSTKIRLLQAIEGQKPFANFKHQIENAHDYRGLWFAFRREKNIDCIRKQLSNFT